MFRPSTPAAYRRLIPPPGATCHVDQAIHQRAALELDPDWASTVHPLLECEVAQEICRLWDTVEGDLRTRHGLSLALETIVVSDNGTILAETRQYESFDTVEVVNVLGVPPACGEATPPETADRALEVTP